MCGRSNDSTSLPEPFGPIDERLVYRLTAEGKKALEESERSNGKPAYSKTRCTSEVAESPRRSPPRSGEGASANAGGKPGSGACGWAP